MESTTLTALRHPRNLSEIRHSIDSLPTHQRGALMALYFETQTRLKDIEKNQKRSDVAINELIEKSRGMMEPLSH